MSDRKRIVIVEDDRDSLLGLKVILTKNGYAVSHAEDAAQAMTVCVRTRPDLIVLDLGLPAGGGQFVLESLRENVDIIGTPVIVLSARPAKDNEETLREAFGIAAYLEKPAGSDMLLKTIEHALEPSRI